MEGISFNPFKVYSWIKFSNILRKGKAKIERIERKFLWYTNTDNGVCVCGVQMKTEIFIYFC